MSQKYYVDGESWDANGSPVEDNISEQMENWDEQIDNLATNRQVGGSHYKNLKLEVVDIIYANKLSWCLGNVIKMICRDKENRVQDLLKAKHYIDLELQLAHGVDPDGNDIGPRTVEFQLTK